MGIKRSFDIATAKEIHSRLNDVLKVQKNLLRSFSVDRRNIDDSLSDLFEKHYLDKLIEKELTDSNVELSKVIFEDFIRNTVLFVDKNKSYSKFEKEAKTRFQRLESQNEFLQLGFSKISWFFMNAEKRKVINSAYEIVNEYATGPEIIKDMEALGTIDKINKLTIDEAIEKYTKRPKTYYNFLTTLPREKRPLAKTIKNLNSCFAEIDNKTKEINNSLDNVKQQIKKAVDKLMFDAILSILHAIPVDELSRYKKGLKVKSLKDAGYLSIGDIYLNQHGLFSVLGISEDTAITILRRSQEYINQVSKETKIRITSDNKTKESGEVVKEIYRYRLAESSLRGIRELNAGYDRSIVQARRNILEVGDGLIWPFLSIEEKTNISNDYKFLVNIVKEGYIDKAQVILYKSVNFNEITLEDAWNDFAKNSVEYFNVIEEVCPGVLGGSDSIYGLPEGLAEEIQDECFFPDGLLCTLRKYQEWGVKYILHQGKVLLGDEMGLGKTVQAIATMVSLKNTGSTHFMVVCPASVVVNWMREIAKHSRLRPIRVHGAGKQSSLNYWLRNGGVAVTTYETTSMFQFYQNFHLHLLIVDEAHYVKNREANRTQNVIRISEWAERILFMTGTPLENHVDEMISLIEILNEPVAEKAAKIAYMAAASKFREEIAPVYYRRKRENVLSELPDLIEKIEWCEMTSSDEIAYAGALNHSSNYHDARRVSWNVPDLKQSSKFNRLLEIIGDAREDNRKVLIFSFYLDTIRRIFNELGPEICLNPISGKISPKRRQEIIDEFENAPDGSVLLAQITSGGTGLNIQAASVVVLCEPQLKPSIENQAISRAYRMGQTKSVQVFRLLCSDSIDERIKEILDEKQAEFDAFADKSVAAEQTNVEVDNKKIGEIIKEEIERINKLGIKAGVNDYVKTNEDSITIEESTPKNNDYKSREDKHPSYKDTSNKYKTVNQDKVPEPHFYKKYKAEYLDELKLTYEELISHLIKKYGPVNGSYFLTPTCSSPNTKIRRGNEGLYIHHIKEDREILLSTSMVAKGLPFEYQEGKNLVYCDLLEHLILHIKITEELSQRGEGFLNYGINGAFSMIIPQINEIYAGNEFTRIDMVISKRKLDNHLDDYIAVLSYLQKIVMNDDDYDIYRDPKLLCVDRDKNLVERIYKFFK